MLTGKAAMLAEWLSSQLASQVTHAVAHRLQPLQGNYCIPAVAFIGQVLRDS
jgi:hypothetical protein